MTRARQDAASHQGAPRDDTLPEIAVRYAGFFAMGCAVVLGETLVRMDEFLSRVWSERPLAMRQLWSGS
jgi:hypothetical protein